MVRNPWFRFGLNAWSLGIDTSSVIALRTLKIAAGGLAAEVADGQRKDRDRFGSTGAGAYRRAWPYGCKHRD